jgi:hypothetical protein
MVLTPWRKNISEEGNAFIERLVRLGIPALQLAHESFGSDIARPERLLFAP